MVWVLSAREEKDTPWRQNFEETKLDSTCVCVNTSFCE
jgi:hypothetical protein